MNHDDKKLEVRDMRNGDWLWTSKAILFSQYISDSAYRVYSALASFSGNSDQRSWPSHQTLAQKLNCSRSTVIRSLRLLEACEVIRVDRRDGVSNLYVLLPCKEVLAPVAPKKEESSHHRLIQFFHETTKKTRGIKPLWNPQDTAHLKRVLSLTILSEEQLEQLMLYFLASSKFKRYSPSMAVFFSAGIFNGLMNSMKNDPGFWKELDRYAAQFMGEDHKRIPISLAKMTELIKELEVKMTIKKQEAYAGR